MTARCWAWLGAAALVPAAIVAAFVTLNAYGSARVAAAGRAAETELAASQLDALEWRAIAHGRLPPGAQARVTGLLDVIERHAGDASTAGQGGFGAAAQAALARYAPAVREEFRLIGAGRLTAAHRVDDERVDPAFADLTSALRRDAAGSAREASRARALALGGEIATVGLGLAAVTGLLIAGKRRALAAAVAEQRVLRETSKAKSDLLSVVSHDLRTPLTSITGYLEILREGGAGPVTGGQQRFLAVMQRNADRLLAIVNDLLFISRAEEHRLVLDFRGLSLGSAAADVVEGQQLRARAREIGLTLETEPALPVRGDRRRVDELIENLVSNAIKYTPPGGSVRVHVGPSGDRVRLKVADTGVGIAPEDQKHLFERFYRSPEVAGTPGTGLGLAIVKAIADAHGAAISVRSMPGEGTTVQVSFPPLAELPASGRDTTAAG